MTRCHCYYGNKTEAQVKVRQQLQLQASATVMFQSVYLKQKYHHLCYLPLCSHTTEHQGHISWAQCASAMEPKVTKLLISSCEP